MKNLRLNALAIHLGVEVEDLNISSYNDQVVEYDGEEYLVVTDDEADDLWDESLDDYLEECIYPELPNHLRNYFNDEAWKRDARFDGRGHSLSSYDGEENDITVYYDEDENLYSDDCVTFNESTNEDWVLDENETFYIYRQN